MDDCPLILVLVLVWLVPRGISEIVDQDMLSLTICLGKIEEISLTDSVVWKPNCFRVGLSMYDTLGNSTGSKIGRRTNDGLLFLLL